VKVQRPNIKRILQNDIALMNFTARILDHTRIFGGTRSRDVVAEFSRWTEEETDYVVEARHATVLRENARGDKLQKDAGVFLNLTSSRVLTMELIKGIPLIDIFTARQQNNLGYLRSLEERGYDLQIIASHISWNALNQVYRQGYFHGDLHPANLFVLPDNVIAYVDYGIVGTLDAEVRESLVHYAWSLFQGDTARAVVEFMRWITPTDQTDVDAARDELVAVMNDFILTTRSKTNHSNKESYSVFEVKLMNTVRNNQMRLSHKLVSYFKAAVTLSAVVYQLAPDFDIAWHENLFFGRMAVQDIREWTNPHHFSRTVFDYAFRLRRMFVGMEGLGQVGQTVQTALLKIRRRMLSLGGLALVVGIALYGSFTKPGNRFLRSIIGDRAQYLPEILLGVFVLLVIGMMHQGQRLFRERKTIVNEDVAWQERWRRGPIG
jgi:ubiquinone biosynthesis protein